MNFKIFEHRSVIKFLTKQGIGRKDIYEHLVCVYGDQVPTNSTVKKWAAEFKRGQQSIYLSNSRPVDLTTPEHCAAVQRLRMAYRRLKVQQIADTLSISYSSVDTILHEKLGLSKVCARWVPRSWHQCRKWIA